MAKFDDESKNTPAPKKPKISVRLIIAIALIGIFVVLLLSNLNAVVSPFKKLNSILAPITIGLVLAYILNFFVRFFEYKLFNKIKKRTVNRALAMIFSYLLLLAVTAGIVLLVVPNVVKNARSLIDRGLEYLQILTSKINDFVTRNVPFLAPEDGADILNLEKFYQFIVDILNTSGSFVISQVATIAGSTLTVLKNILVGLFISIYVLLSKERLNAGCRRVFRALFSEKHEKILLHYLSTAHKKFGGYMIGKVADSMMVMLVCMLLFTIFRIPYAILISVIIGVTDIIPFFGPFLGAIPSGVIVLCSDNPAKVFLFALLILVIQQIDGNLIAPFILGDRTGLSSLGVIVAVTLMGSIFGIPGMLIGVPLFALIMTLLDDFIKHRLKNKGYSTNLAEYYPADAFIRPQDEVKDDDTAAQRFARWVAAVETEEAGKDYRPSFFHSIGRGIRIAFLAIGRSFKRFFSVRPIPEDGEGGIFQDIVKNGMRTDRKFWRVLILSILTLGIYALYMVDVVAQSSNLACRKDGKRTWGFFPFLLLSILTFGIYTLIWHCAVIRRMQIFCRENGQQCRVSRKFYLLWTLFGLPIVVGPFIALGYFVAAFNQMCTIYNASHTFPLDLEELKAEMELPVKETRPRMSLIDQINEFTLPAEDYGDAPTEEAAPQSDADDTAPDDSRTDN